MRERVGIIGAGIFGLSCALELNDTHNVVVFDQASDILSAATFANHNRHHLGYHYPRSLETARQCLESRDRFEARYGDCCNAEFTNYYCIAKDQTKTTPDQYVRFCDEVGLRYKEEWPPDGVIDRAKFAAAFTTEEGVYDFPTLKRLVSERLSRAANVEVRLNYRAVDAGIEPSGGKSLVIEDAQGGRCTETFDYVINAMYANSNRFCDWMGFDPRLFQFNLQELCVIELPLEAPIGVTIQDGPFPSFIPMGFTGNRYLFAHVEASQLVRHVSAGDTPLLNRVSNIQSNWRGTRDASLPYVPLLAEADYVHSIFVDRIVDATKSDTDARITDVTNHGQGCWSVFAAKIITCECTAEWVAASVRG